MLTVRKATAYSCLGIILETYEDSELSNKDPIPRTSKTSVNAEIIAKSFSPAEHYSKSYRLFVVIISFFF